LKKRKVVPENFVFAPVGIGEEVTVHGQKPIDREGTSDYDQA
jgi:hypothetical protein